MRHSKRKPRDSSQKGNDRLYNTPISKNTEQTSSTLSEILSHQPINSISSFTRFIMPDGTQKEEVKFDKMQSQNPSFSVGDISGNNVSINTTNSFNTHVNINFDKIDSSLFEEAKNLIEKEITENQELVQKLHADIDAMQHYVEIQDKKQFLKGYCKFMGHLSDHVTVLPPIVTLLKSIFF